MDKLELDDRVCRLERRASLQSLVMTLAGLAVLGAVLVGFVGRTSYQSQEAIVTATPIRSPAYPSLEYEVELRQARQMYDQGLITRDDFEQKKEMILAAPMTFDDDFVALKAARSLVSDGALTEDEYQVMKRKILEFGK
jgi:hypothetical protein